MLKRTKHSKALLKCFFRMCTFDSIFGRHFLPSNWYASLAHLKDNRRSSENRLPNMYVVFDFIFLNLCVSAIGFLKIPIMITTSLWYFSIWLLCNSFVPYFSVFMMCIIYISMFLWGNSTHFQWILTPYSWKCQTIKISYFYSHWSQTKATPNTCLSYFDSFPLLSV